MTREEAIQYAEDKLGKGLYRLDLGYLNRGLYQIVAREVDFMRVAIAALREQEESEGRVIVLPCKEGDIVYEVKNNTDACRSCQHYSSWFGMDCICDKQDFDSEYHEYPECAERPICEKQFMEVVEYQPNIEAIFRHRNDFGKTIFLNREEAEKALRRLEEA